MPMEFVTTAGFMSQWNTAAATTSPPAIAHDCNADRTPQKAAESPSRGRLPLDLGNLQANLQQVALARSVPAWPRPC